MGVQPRDLGGHGSQGPMLLWGDSLTVDPRTLKPDPPVFSSLPSMVNGELWGGGGFSHLRGLPGPPPLLPVSPCGACGCHVSHLEEGSSPAWALRAAGARTGPGTAPHLPPLRPAVGRPLGAVGEGRRVPAPPSSQGEECVRLGGRHCRPLRGGGRGCRTKPACVSPEWVALSNTGPGPFRIGTGRPGLGPACLGKVWPQLLGPRPQAWPLPSPGPGHLMGT